MTENPNTPKSPMEGILDELMRSAGPHVTAATWKKVARAKAALLSLEAQADAEIAVERAKHNYVVTFAHPEHGEVKINRRALTVEEAEKAAAKLAPGFKVVESRAE
jgi:hypothetical protein